VSFPAIRFALDFPKLSANGRLTLLMLADRAGKTGHCYPSQAYLADKSQLSISSVRRALAELEKVGALKRSKRFNQSGRTSDDYLLLMKRVGVTENTTKGANLNTTPRSQGTTIPTSPYGVGKGEEEEGTAKRFTLIEGGRP